MSLSACLLHLFSRLGWFMFCDLVEGRRTLTVQISFMCTRLTWCLIDPATIAAAYVVQLSGTYNTNLFLLEGEFLRNNKIIIV